MLLEEQVARTIDAAAFEPGVFLDDVHWIAECSTRRELAIRKSQAILALVRTALLSRASVRAAHDKLWAETDNGWAACNDPFAVSAALAAALDAAGGDVVK